MINFSFRRALVSARFAAFLILLCSVPLLQGCSSLNFIKRKVTVPPLLAPLVEADTAQLINEINRVASVKSLRGKVDIQFLDTSFAKCGVAEKYRTADGTVIVERPGRVNLRIQVPFAGTDVAQMASDGERFQVAVLQGDTKYRRFVRGTNSSVYPKLETGGGGEADCGGGGEKKTLRHVAQHADIWHGFGDAETISHKHAVLDEWCAKAGRDSGEIERSSGIPGDADIAERASELYAVGTRLFTLGVGGPGYDLAPIRDLVAWRDDVNAKT